MKTTSTTTTLRTALYARVSTTGPGQDVGLQLDELPQVARQRGWHVVAEHVDDGVSGATTSRPALDRLMDAARRGRIDLVAVWRFDRFARSTQHLLAALDEFRTLGVDLISGSGARHLGQAIAERSRSMNGVREWLPDVRER
jgi:DNA invertase Pin-like site-specific DNA recombinase